MDFRVLGTLEVTGADGPRHVHGRKELCVLAYLLVHAGRAVPADELVHAVWGEDAPPSAGKSLQVRVSHLRHDLDGGGEPVIVRDGGGYRLAVEPEDVDAHRFERLLADAGGRPAREALALYDQALAEVRGRPYADVADLDFATSEVRRLEELRLSAVEGRLRALVDLGRHVEALPELERVAPDEPLHEGLTVLRMLALYRAGRQAESLDAYRALARRLADLGLEPSDEARALEGRILRQDAGLAAPSAARSASNLGERLTSFVDREAECAAVAERLTTHPLVTLCGPGGVGKSSVAVETARTLVERFPDGVCAADLAAVDDATQVPVAVAAALGVAGAAIEPGSRTGAQDVVRDHLRDRSLLLLLDNCEHVAEAAARLAEDLLVAAPRVRVLATSRQALGAGGEAIVDVGPLPAEPAVQLFAERARAVRPDFALDERRRAAVEAICARLDGLPLALELAAARVRALPVGDLAARLDDRFSVLAGATTGADERHRTLSGVVEWSYGLLSVPERALFRRLSIFRGPFTVGAAEAAVADAEVPRERVADLLAALVERSMAAVDEGPPRGYRLLHTLRAFGHGRLEAAGELEEVSDRHAAYFAARARVVADRAWSSGTDTATVGLSRYREDVAAACDYAIGRGRADQAVPLAAAVALLDYRIGNAEAGRERIDAALALPGGSVRDRVAALRYHAVLLAFDGRVDAAADATETAQLLAEGLHEAAERDRVRAVVGLTLLLARDIAGAREAFEGLEERFVARGDWWILGFVSGWSAFLDVLDGQLRQAQVRSRRACDAFERSDDLWGFLSSSVNLGRACLALGDYDEAAATYDRALAVAEPRIGDRIVPLLHDAGIVAVRRHDAERARTLWTRCAECADRDLGRTGGWVLLTARGLRWYPLMAAGHVARMDGDLDEAERRYGQGRALLEGLERQARRPIGLPYSLAYTRLLQSRVAEDAGRAGDALEAARDGLRRAIVSGDRRLTARGLDALAAALSLTGDPAEAGELLGLAETIREKAGGPLAAPEQGDVDRVAARVRDALGDDGLAAALRRGRARSLRDVA